MTDAAPPIVAPAATGWRGRLVRWQQIMRYYQAGVLNLGFGYLLYALFVYLGMNPFLAQAVAHVCGTGFNYVTYSRHVFRDSAPAKTRFLASYAVNYLLGVAILAGLRLVIESPYIAGGLTALLVSVINFIMLKFLVFSRPAP